MQFPNDGMRMNSHITEQIWGNTGNSQVLLYLIDLELMKTHVISDVWKCTNSLHMEIFCRKSGCEILKKFEIFFPISWKIDGNTHIFPTHRFGDVFPVNSNNSQNMGKTNSHSKQKIWENTNIRQLKFL